MEPLNQIERACDSPAQKRSAKPVLQTALNFSMHCAALSLSWPSPRAIRPPKTELLASYLYLGRIRKKLLEYTGGYLTSASTNDEVEKLSQW